MILHKKANSIAVLGDMGELSTEDTFVSYICFIPSSPHHQICIHTMYTSIWWYKHLGIDSSTDLDDPYSNLFLNAYINRHAHTEYLKMIGL